VHARSIAICPSVHASVLISTDACGDCGLSLEVGPKALEGGGGAGQRRNWHSQNPARPPPSRLFSASRVTRERQEFLAQSGFFSTRESTCAVKFTRGMTRW
jgi:hypothetical protein